MCNYINNHLKKDILKEIEMNVGKFNGGDRIGSVPDKVTINFRLKFKADYNWTDLLRKIQNEAREAPKLTIEESKLFLNTVLKQVNQRVPIIVGVSNPGIDNLIDLSNFSMDNDAAGVMIAPPPGIGTEEKLYNYLTNILDKLDDRIPVCYQDYPFFTKSEISVATFNKIIEEYDQ